MFIYIEEYDFVFLQLRAGGRESERMKNPHEDNVVWSQQCL